ncbi:hypothetical protein OAE39_00420 [Akkermansiaceae bacterium]|nr:hypothetical protein [Akkermansiaceae bacterium]
MKRFFSKHSIWALITVITFVFGKQWSQSSRATDVPAGGGVSQNGLEHRGVLGRPSSVPGRGVNSRSVRDSRKAKEGAEKPRRGNQMSQDEIDLLVTNSIKSRSPIERRQAMDQILQKMRNSEMSFENVLAIGEAFKEQGANDEWELLGYAMGVYQSNEAIAHLEKLPAEERVGFIENIIPGLASENADLAINLFESLEPNEQAKVRPELLRGLVDNDAAIATDYIYDSSDLENYSWRPMAELTRELVKDKGLEPTLDWADELPPGPQRRDAWSSAYAVWASKNPVAAGESLNQLPDGEDRNLAINGFVSAHVHQDGEMAMTWIDAISEPGLRDAAMIRVGRQYFQRDPAAATQWYSSGGVAPSIWEQVRNPVEPK